MYAFIVFTKFRKFSAITSINLRHCRFNFQKYYFDLFTSSMSLLNIFSLFSSFLNIWNIVITVLMFQFTNSIICVISGSVSIRCFFSSLLCHIFLLLHVSGNFWVDACILNFYHWVWDSLYSYKYFELSFEMKLFWKVWSFLLHSSRTAFGLGLILPHYWNTTLLSAMPSTSRIMRFPTVADQNMNYFWPYLSSRYFSL